MYPIDHLFRALRRALGTVSDGRRTAPPRAVLRVEALEYRALPSIAAPTNLTAIATDPSAVELRWRDTSTTEQAYLLERSADGAEWVVLRDNLPRNTTAYADVRLPLATRFFYRVRVTDGTTFTAYSNVATAVTPDDATTHQPLDPTGLLSEGYVYAYGDEFDGTALDTTKWNYRVGDRNPAFNRAENVSVGGGTLNIVGLRENFGGREYTGGGVFSRVKLGYGYYEARIQMPSGGGRHTSFWMTGDGGGPNRTATTLEIDVEEQESHNPFRYDPNFHTWFPTHTNHRLGSVSTPNLATSFHTFGAEYTPTAVRYFFDGALVRTKDITGHPQGDLTVLMTLLPIFNLDRFDAADNTPARFDWFRYYAKDAAAPWVNAPTGLTAASAFQTAVTLSWADNSIKETAYVLQRSTNSTFTSPTTITLAANATSYHDTGLAEGVRYYYRLWATNAGGSSAFAAMDVATKLAAPTAGVMTLAPSADAKVQDGAFAGTNFGAGTVLEVKNSGGAEFNRVSYLKLDLTALPSAFTRVTLKLFGSLAGGTEPSVAVNLHGVANTTWTEVGLTYNNRPALGAVFGSFTVQRTAQGYVLDVTDYVRAERAAGRTSAAMALASAQPGAVAVVRFNSKEAATNPARFTVTPGAVTEVAPSADAKVQDGAYAGTNFGAGTVLEVKNSGGAEFNRVSYLKLDLTALPSAFTRVTLKLFGSLAGGTEPSVAVNLHGVANTTWTEVGLTYNNRPALGAVFGSFTVQRTAQGYVLDVTDYVRAERAAGRTSAAMALASAQPGAVAVVRFNSKEAATNPARFAVTAAPLTILASSGRATLSWVDNAAGETGYVIERSTSPAFANDVVSFSAPPNAGSFSDRGLVPGVTYFYRVRAVRSSTGAVSDCLFGSVTAV